jgi:hypothetical protein
VKIPDGMQILFRGKAPMIREIAQVVTDGGVQVATGPIPSGWEPQAWLAVASQDAAKAIALHRAHLEGMVRKQGLPVHDHVADFDAEETQCPACLTKFKTANTSRCPDCGLNFR